MPDMKINSGQGPDAPNTQHVNADQQAQSVAGTPPKDGYAETFEKTGEPASEPNFAQGSGLFADGARLTRKQRLRPDAAKMEKIEGKAKDVLTAWAYPTPIFESEACQRDGEKVRSYRQDMINEFPTRCEIDEMYIRKAVVVFKAANDLDTTMKAALKYFKKAKTPEQMDYARRSMRDVADKMHDFLKDIHFYSVDGHPYTYSRQFNEMFIGIGKSMGKLNTILSE